MKTMCIILLVLVVCPAVFSQDETSSEWQISPSVAVTKYFPGEVIRTQNDIYFATYPPMMTSYSAHKYAGTSLGFSARCFSEDIKPLALTFGAGATWYYHPDGYAIPAASQPGVGAVLGHQDFTAFPISIGVQAVFPYASREKLMAFAGIEGNLHLISGDLAMNQQAKVGFTVLGGFAVKFLEFGVRYTAFSDIKNLGAYFGLRFKSFGI
jgi:hypothetical protein